MKRGLGEKYVGKEGKISLSSYVYKTENYKPISFTFIMSYFPLFCTLAFKTRCIRNFPCFFFFYFGNSYPLHSLCFRISTFVFFFLSIFHFINFPPCTSFFSSVHIIILCPVSVFRSLFIWFCFFFFSILFLQVCFFLTFTCLVQNFSFMQSHLQFLYLSLALRRVFLPRS